MKVIATHEATKKMGGGDLEWTLPPVHFVASLVKKSGNDLTEVVLRSTLKVRDGFVYLAVPEEIVEGFLKLIPKKNVVSPKEVSDKEYVGAHISVMYSDEYDTIISKKKKLTELGDEFEYTLDKMYSTEPESWDDVKEVFFITVKSPELEALRKKYNLRKKLNGHEFHITVACLPRGK